MIHYDYKNGEWLFHNYAYKLNSKTLLFYWIANTFAEAFFRSEVTMHLL